jgi:hypothetical protein
MYTQTAQVSAPTQKYEKQESKLADLLQYNLRSIRSYLLKEEFQLFWAYPVALLGRRVSG